MFVISSYGHSISNLEFCGNEKARYRRFGLEKQDLTVLAIGRLGFPGVAGCLNVWPNLSQACRFDLAAKTLLV